MKWRLEVVGGADVDWTVQEWVVGAFSLAMEGMFIYGAAGMLMAL